MAARGRTDLAWTLAALACAACNTAAPQRARAQPETAAMFTEFANYERFMGRWSRQLAPQLIELAGVRDGDRVLDVGTGTGALALALAERISHVTVVGVDPSAGYIEYARERTDDARLRFDVGDAQAMAYEDGAFDRCVSLLVVNFIPDPAKAVREMRRVTRSGGTVAAAVWDYADGMRMLRVFWDEAVAIDPDADPHDERHMPFCTPDELERLWRDAGLIDVESTALTIEQRFSSFDDYWAPFLLGTGPAGAHAAALDPPRRVLLRERLRRRLRGAGGNGAFTLPARAWAVGGRVP